MTKHFFMILISKPGVGILVNDFIFMHFLHELFFFKCNFCVVHFLLKTYMRPWKENLTEISLGRIQYTSWFAVPKIIFVKSLTKGPLLALRKFLTIESLLKSLWKKCFLFDVQSSFSSWDLCIVFISFWLCTKRAW